MCLEMGVLAQFNVHDVVPDPLVAPMRILVFELQRQPNGYFTGSWSVRDLAVLGASSFFMASALP